jgi:hypothetical protein
VKTKLVVGKWLLINVNYCLSAKDNRGVGTNSLKEMVTLVSSL